MSYQYINPYILSNRPIVYTQTGGQNVQSYAFQTYNTNPYQYSFYNQNATGQNIQYPFNPIYAANTNGKYMPLGQIKAPTGDTINLFQLANGQKVAIVPRKNEATIVKTFLDAGSINETDDIRGISHCIEHFLFNGSSKLNNGDVFKLTGLMGASTNASTDYAQVDYYIQAPMMSEENLKKSIEIQGDMVSKPTFDYQAIEAEKGPICSEISMMADNPLTNASDRAIKNLFQINSNSNNLVAGSVETVKNLSQDTVKNHHQTYYDPKNLYTVIVGDVDVNNTINYVADNFTIPKKDVYVPKYHEELNLITKPVREDIKSDKTNKSYVVCTFAGPCPKNAKDFYVLDSIGYFLKNFSTSNLNSDLKNMNGYFEYDIQKVGLKEDNPYAIFNVFEINPNNVQDGIDSYYDAIQKLQNDYLSADDLNALKKNLKKQYSINLCNSQDICDSIGRNLIDGTIGSYSNVFQIIDSITPDDIVNCARKYYDLDKISMVAIHPKNISNDKIRQDYDNSKYSLKQIDNKKQVAVNFTGAYKPKSKSVKQYKLQNNTHIAINNTNSDICVFNWNIDTPPIKPKNSAAPRVLQYMFDDGTSYKDKNEITRYKELNGIASEIYVNGKSINISADSLPENINQTLALMNELLYHPNFNQEQFENAKKLFKEELEISDKDAKSNLLDKLFPGYFPTKPQILKEIDALTLDDVKEFYNELLKNASSKMVATIPYEKYPTLIQNVINYQSIPNVIFKENVQKFNSVFTKNDSSKVIIDTDNVNQAQIYKTYQFPMSGNVEDEAKFEIVNLVLGGSANSRLFADLREKQNLAYAVSSTVQSFENSGVLTMKIQTTTDYNGAKSYDNVEKSLEGFKEHSNRLCEELISDEELESAKMKLKQSVIGQCQNPYLETNLLSINIAEPYGIERIDKYLEAIDKITKEDIRDAAKHIFSNYPTISILASKDTIDSQMDYLNTQGEVIKP